MPKLVTLNDFGFINPIYNKNRSWDKMKIIEVPKLDISPYVGAMTQIAKAEVCQGQFGKFIKVETSPIKLNAGDSLPDGVLLRASVILGLLEQENGELAIRKGSKTEEWMKSHNVDIRKIPDDIKLGDMIKAFEGIRVVVQKQEGNINFLTIA